MYVSVSAGLVQGCEWHWLPRDTSFLSDGSVRFLQTST